MRAALHTPWRVSGFDPATVVRHTTKSAPTPLNRFYSTCHTSANSIPSSRVLANPRNRSTTPRELYTRGRVLPLRHYSSESPAQETASTNNNGKKRSGPIRSRNKTYLIIGGALGVAAVVYSDEVRHLYRAAARTGRVVSALAVCINE